MRTLGRASSFALTALAVACSSAPASQSTEQPQTAATAPPSSPSTSTAAHTEWRKSAAKTLLHKEGCFRVTEPSTTWEEIPCEAAPTGTHGFHPSRGLPHLATPHSAAPSRITPSYINGGNDNTTAESLIRSATGSFPWEVGGGNEGSAATGNSGNPTYPGANSYSLQMNTNTFPSLTDCAAQYYGGCQGWQQWIYDPKEGQAYIEYSLIDWQGSCPSKYGSSYTTPQGTPVCFYNSKAVSVPAVLPTALETISMSAATSTPVSGVETDTILVTVSGTAYAENVPSTLLLENGGWNDAEFNVFGENTDAEAIFSDPTTLQVRVDTALASGSYDPPSCNTGGGGTAESSTLNLNGFCCPFGGPYPGILFEESTVPGSTPHFVCPVAPSCTYSFSCANDGQVAATCDPDGASPSNTIAIYKLADAEAPLSLSMQLVGEKVFTPTSPGGPTLIADVTTVPNSAQSQMSLVGCAVSPWGSLTCDPVTTGATPSCVGEPCVSYGVNGHWDGDGQCVTPCVPGTCQSLGKGCGTWADGCGGQVSCGGCAGSTVCENGTCVGSGNYCEECTKTGGICSSSGGKSVCVHR